MLTSLRLRNFKSWTDTGPIFYWNIRLKPRPKTVIGLVMPSFVGRWRILTNMAVLTALATKRQSQFGAVPLEGVVIRRDGDRFSTQRAKLVRPDFIQDIGDHWRRRKMEWNRVGAA